MNRYFFQVFCCLCLAALLLSGCSGDGGSKKSVEKPIHSVYDLAGRRIACLNGSIFPDLTDNLVKDVSYSLFNDNPSSIQALRSRKVAALLLDEPVARLAVAKFPRELRLVQVFAADSYGIAFQKNSRFSEPFGKFVRQMRASGELDRLVDKWCNQADPSKKFIPVWSHKKDFDGKGGVFRYFTDSTSEPMCYMGPGGKLMGLEVELISRFVYEQNMVLEIKPMSFDGLIGALLVGRSEAVGGSMSITPDRRKKVDFPEAHYMGGVTIVARREAGDSEDIETFSQLYGKRIGVLEDSTWEKMVRQNFISSVPVRFKTVFELPDALKTGKIQAFLADEPQARMMIRKMPSLYHLKKRLSDDDYAFAFAKNQEEIRNDFNRELIRMKKNGTLAKLQDKWFSDNDGQLLMPPRLENPPKGILKLAVDPQVPPFAYSRDQKVIGYEIELAQSIAAKLGYALEPVPMGWKEATESVVQGNFPMTAGCLTITPQRKLSMLFSEPTYHGGIVVVTARTDKARQKTGPLAWIADKCRELKMSFYRTLIQEQRWKMLAKGLKATLIISLASALFGTILSFGVCFLHRIHRFGLNYLAQGFVVIMQRTPILVFLMILYYLLFADIEINPLMIAIIGFALNFAAYVSEMIRVGFEGIPRGQFEAASALGFSTVQTFLFVTLPQVLRRILPIYRGEFISMLKSTSIVGYIAIEDLTQMSDNIRSRTYEAFFPLLLTTAIYFIIAHIIVTLIDRWGRRLDPVFRRARLKGGKN